MVSVGQSGEQSLKRIESAGGKASGGLQGLGRQAGAATGIRTLGGTLAGVATVGGLAALVDRSISAADAIGKTADKIGVGVEALQELRFAAKASGVEQQTLDMALQRFTRRAAEAAQGTARQGTRSRRWASRCATRAATCAAARTCSATSRTPSPLSRIREGKNALRWTRLSCHAFRHNAVRLQLHALAYNLANFMRTLALPEEVEHWSLTTLRESWSRSAPGSCATAATWCSSWPR